MPAMTSPLSALRFSGRLMVIQNACPRFSVTTTVVSLMARFLGSGLPSFAAGRAAGARGNLRRGAALAPRHKLQMRDVRAQPQAATAFLIQTLLSWKAAPPIGAIASAPVSMLMPRPPIWFLFG